VLRQLQRIFTRAHVFGYRFTGGRIVGRWGKAPILLLTTRGRKSGRKRTTPVLYLDDGGHFVVVATNNGAPTHPEWYLNLVAKPQAEVQAGGESFAVEARTAGAEERATLWPRLLEIYGNYGRDQKRTERELPVVILEPRECS
jgi:F420H(2)-dependent quinone reductase